MKTITMYNSKGGVGKSTIVDELLFYLNRNDVSWQYVDFDGQGGMSHSAGPQARAEITVMDMPGEPTDRDADALRHSDVVIVPMINSPKNIAATTEGLSLIRDVAPDARVVLVINHYVARAHVDKTFIVRGVWEWLAGLRDEGTLPDLSAIVLVPESTVVRSADTAGISVVDYDRRSSVARAVSTLCSVLLAAAVEDDEQFHATLDGMADNKWMLPVDKIED